MRNANEVTHMFILKKRTDKCGRYPKKCEIVEMF